MARPITPMEIMPARILSLQKYSRASRIRYPSPLLTAIISATITTMNATPMPTRRPARIDGIAPGKSTRQKSVPEGAPRFCAART